jgi:(p)ppGpp synthase/HD superfamily hydrolase
MNTKSLSYRAALFAMNAHASQVRRYTSEPYHKHLAEVAALVALVPHSEEQIAASWLHDVVEDQPITLNDLQIHFGNDVARLVEQVTDVSRPGDGNRAVRKALDLEHLRRASPAAQSIKYADLISNTHSIVTHDRKFAGIYLQEKQALLSAMPDGDPLLRQLAMRELMRARASLMIAITATNDARLAKEVA